MPWLPKIINNVKKMDKKENCSVKKKQRGLWKGKFLDYWSFIQFLNKVTILFYMIGQQEMCLNGQRSINEILNSVNTTLVFETHYL